MPRIALTFPSGLQGDDTTFEAKGRWADASCVRFRLGLPETIGGWESLTTALLTGVCRRAFPFTDNANNLTIGFGTHSNLQLWQGGALYDITPTLALPGATLASEPFTVAAASPTITVTQPSHGLTTSDSVALSGSPKVGRQVISSATYAIASVVDANTYTITNGSNFTLAKTLGAAPLATANASTIVTVTDTGHNLEDGCTVTISGAAAVGGITPNGAFAISVIDANTYSYHFTASASSAATGGGSSVVATAPTIGGSGAIVAPQRAYFPGQIDGTGTSGFGTGAYGVGGYGLPSTADYFPRTWSFGAWGENMLACPRNGTIYAWTNDVAQVAQPLLNAPQNVQFMLVAPNSGGYQVFALGCNQEADGVFNPMCIRHSSVRIDTEWNTSNLTTAREYTLTGGGRIVAGRMCGPYLLVWTNDSLFLGQFAGALDQPWSFTQVAKNCGLMGPNAAVVHGQVAYWMSPDRQFYTYSLGGEPAPVDCPIRDEFAENLAASQGDKVVASTNSEYSEVRFDYPDQRDGTGYENSRYLSVCISGADAGAWSRGVMARTAFVDAGPSQYPIATTYGGNVYFHEKGNSADGAAFPWFIQSADQYVDENLILSVQGIWPDLFLQQGPVYVEVTSRFYPQDTETTTGPLLMSPGAQKVDFRTTGRLFRFRFSGNSGPTFARLGKFDVDLAKNGLR